MAIPLWRMPVLAVGERRHARQTVVGRKFDRGAATLGAEAERAVLVVQRVVIAARQKGTHAQGNRTAGAGERPRDNDRTLVLDEDLLNDPGAIGEVVFPRCPRLARELRDVR